MITPEVAEKLHRAIDLAQGPGRCRYTEDGKPCCVIGQFAALNGYDQLWRWEGTAIQYLYVRLGEVDGGYLGELQRIWDRKGGADETTRRRRMHELVDSWLTES